jgi:hypothetical protein
MQGEPRKAALLRNKAREKKGKLDLLHRFARLYQHPLLLDSDSNESTVEELKAGSSKLREVLLNSAPGDSTL